MHGDHVYLADPSRGNIRLTLADFEEEEWKREAFVLGKQGFGIPVEHNLSIIAPDSLLARYSLMNSSASRAAPTKRQLLGDYLEL